MSLYLVKRTDQGGGYLTPPGSQHSYSQSLRQARTFLTREAAEAECCENERAVALEDEMGGA